MTKATYNGRLKIIAYLESFKDSNIGKKIAEFCACNSPKLLKEIKVMVQKSEFEIWVQDNYPKHESSVMEPCFYDVLQKKIDTYKHNLYIQRYTKAIEETKEFLITFKNSEIGLLIADFCKKKYKR